MFLDLDSILDFSKIFNLAGWWFQIFLIFPLFGEDEPILTHIFKGVETTK